MDRLWQKHFYLVVFLRLRIEYLCSASAQINISPNIPSLRVILVHTASFFQLQSIGFPSSSSFPWSHVLLFFYFIRSPFHSPLSPSTKIYLQCDRFRHNTYSQTASNVWCTELQLPNDYVTFPFNGLLQALLNV